VSWLSALGACLSSDVLKLRRTHALVLPLLLPAAPPLVFFVYVLQRGTADYPAGVSPVAWTVEGVSTIWVGLLLPVFASVLCSMLASIEHHAGGFKQLMARPLPRSAVWASKLALAVGLVALAHVALSAYTSAAVWGLGRLRADAGFAGPLHVGETLATVALVGAGGACLVAIHAIVALRWAGFAMNVGLSLVGLLFGVVLVESELRNFYPWSQPAAVQNVAWPLVFGLSGRGGPATLAVLVAASVVPAVGVMVAGVWWLGRRDVP
jgi:hypothetical protein